MEKKLAYRIKDLVEAGIGSRTTIYELIKDRKLTARKRGTSTIILPDDLDEYLKNLPDFNEEEAA